MKEIRDIIYISWNKGVNTMERIIDVYGKTAPGNEGEFEEATKWCGRILLGKDHTFEGVAADTDKRTFFYLCGSMEKDTISLFKAAEKDQHIPYHFNATKDGFKFSGLYAATNIYSEEIIGECRLSLIPAEQTREESDHEREMIKERIEIVKHRLGDNGQAIAHFFEQDRKEVVESAVQEGK